MVDRATCLTNLILALAVLLICPMEVNSATNKTITVGSKKFTESVLLGEIAVDLVEEAGYSAKHQRQLGGSRILWESLLKGEIELYPDYTGTIRKVLLPDQDYGTFTDLREALNRRGLGVTDPLGFNNTYAVAMKKKRAKKLGIESISDLKDHPDLTMGFTNEFMDRDDGWPGLREAYSLPHKDVQGLDHDLAYRGLGSGDIDVIDAYTTDPEIEYHDLRLLKDDKNYFPTYRAVFLYRKDLEDTVPDVVENIKLLEKQLSAKQMSSLNKMVKIDGNSEDTVAKKFIDNDLGFQGSVDTQGMFSTFMQRTIEHLYLVVVSLSIAIILAIPLGVLATYREDVGQLILGIVGILQTIPSLALLVFMIPLFGIGTRPAMVALFLYSLLPIVRNTYAGINGISREIIESARAVGFPERMILLKVKLPLALRSILAGIKTSAVINVGIATLGALIGAGGYGQPILTGIRLDDMILVLQGAVPAALLALGVQGLLDLIGVFLIPEGLQLDNDAGN